jgi:hypothetical protein
MFWTTSLLAQTDEGSASTDSYTIHDSLFNGQYVDTTCMIHITNDSVYYFGSTITLTIYQSDTTKMLKISGHALLDSIVNILIYVGTPENGLLLPSDTVITITPCRTATFIFDIPAGSTPQFHYTVECVNSLYEQPDTNIAIVPDNNGIIYVTQEGSGLRNGSSWANATPWLNRALGIADTMTEKPVIWVAAGTYYGTPQMTNDDDAGYALNVEYAFLGRNGVNIYGGFAGNEPTDYDLNLRNFEQNETILDGLLHHTVVNVGAAEWNGFHIQRGTNGCGIKESSIIRHCVISDCANNGITRTQYEVGIIDSCSIIDNGGHGIAVGLTNRISNSLVSRNAGDGIRSGGTVLNCEITQNGGGGFVATSWMGFSRIGVVNCLIANNGGDGVFLESNNYKVTNATIVNNGGIGVKLRGGGHEVRNSIIYGNAGISIDYPGYVNISNFVLNNCAVDGNYLLSSHNVIPLASPSDTLGFYPGFVSPTIGAGNTYSGGDWHLLPNSVCVNRGATYSDYFPDTDIEGNPRILLNTPDIGAYESAYNLQCEDGKIIYVKADGEGDGSSWSNATSDLNHAIESAWGYGPNTRIWVAQGTYPTLGHPYYLKENLHLLGGFVGNEPADYDVSLRNPLTHPSILDGQNQNQVLLQMFDFEGSENALIDGFTLTHGLAGNGAAVSLMANTTLSKCKVVNNVVTNMGNAVVIAAHDTLKQLLVENNDGTGVHAESSQVLHCTVVRNNGDGIQVSVNSIQDSGKLCNNIIWGNALQNLHFTSFMAHKNTPVMHCAIENQVMDGEHNITLSSDNENGSGPHFVNPSDSVGVVNNLGDWQIDSSSVCVNTGAELSVLYGIQTDLAGQLRLQNEIADIGALESSYNGKTLYRNMEISIYEGESYTFYDTILTTAGWYEHRWNVGEADSLVVLHLITKQVVYVSVTGAGNMDGSSWTNALDGQTATANGNTKLANALQAATVGTEIWIQSGTYHACSDSDINKSLILNSGVALYGGFTGTETAISQRDPYNAPTVFSGNLQNDTVVEHYSRNIFKTNEQNSPHLSIILNKMVIKEGYNTDHTGTALQNNITSNIQLSHCEFINHYGTAIFNEGFLNCDYCIMDSNSLFYDIQQVNYPFIDNYRASAMMNQPTGCISMSHCQITNNNALEVGAIYNLGVMTIDSSKISHNKAIMGTVGAILSDGVLNITNSEISNNYSYRTASSICAYGFLKLYNCVVDSNQSCRIGPEYWWPQKRWISEYSSYHISITGTADVQNCLFKGNNQNGEIGGGCLHIDGYATVKNCHFINNLSGATSCFSFITWGTDSTSGGGATLQLCYNHDGSDGGGIHVENGEAYVEDCLFDGHIGKSGTSASVKSGKLTMNRCVFSRNRTEYSDGDRGILSIKSGELIVQNSLFANNQNTVFNTVPSAQRSNTTFFNCTFVNNEDKLCVFNNPEFWDGMGYFYDVYDTAYVHFNNSIIVGNWEQTSEGLGLGGKIIYPNYIVQFSNTILHHPDSTLATDCTPDSLGNIYYCDPMFVNPTTVMGVDSAQNPLLYDFRLQAGSPAINTGDTTGLHLTANATDLDEERRVKQCLIDRGCYEYGTVVFDTILETICVEPEALNQYSYTGHGFALAQLEVGENTFTRNCDCHTDANDTVLTLRLFVSLIQQTEDEAVACDSMLWHNEIFRVSGDYTRTFTNGMGCDSVVTMHLTVKTSSLSEFSDTVCGSYTWNNETYTESGDYTQTLTNAAGCDSVVTLHLTVHHAVDTVIYDYFCNGSTYPFFGENLSFAGTYTHTGQTEYGCDSTVILYLTVNQPVTSTSSVTICDSELPYVWNGLTFNETGTQSLTLQTVNGCDSVVTLHLTVNQSVASDEYLVIYDSELPYHYVNGEINTIFEIGTSSLSTFSFQFLTQDGCDSVVTIHLTIETGINDHNMNASLKVYPNPTTDIINVQLTMNNEQLNNVEIQVFDMYGKLLDVVNIGHTDAKNHVPTDPSMDSYGMANVHGASSKTTQIDLSRYANGVYFIKAVSDGNMLAVRKVVKNK